MKKTEKKIIHKNHIPKDEKEVEETIKVIEEVKKEKVDYSKLKKITPKDR